ncbi:MAG TPA: hypothetical protein VMQ62_00210 [Dongiaceae bacterium]|nr:hypothetical protein [Dongiaceae bacterium]
MTLRRMLVSAVLLIGLLALAPPAGSAAFESMLGILEKDNSCPEATHILRWPCPGGGAMFYLVFPKGREGDAAPFLNQNVAVRGTLKSTTCALPLAQVSRVTASDVLPPCADPGTN